MNERQMKWNYPLLDASENKAGPRTATPSKFSYEVIGADLSIRGGIRPFPGFKRVHNFSSLASQTNHTTSSRVTDIFPISFRVGTDQFGYGFVYRAERPADKTLSDIYIDYRIKGKTSGDWNFSQELKLTIPTASPMDVVVFGKYIYVLVQGEEPILFYVGYGVSAAATGTVTVNSWNNITKGTVATTTIKVDNAGNIGTGGDHFIYLTATDGTLITVTAHASTTTTTDITNPTYEVDGASNDNTAANIRICINAVNKFQAGVLGDTVTVIQNVGGTDGNTTTTFADPGASAFTIPAAFTGGVDTADSIVIRNVTGSDYKIYAGSENDNIASSADYKGAFKPLTSDVVTATNIDAAYTDITSIDVTSAGATDTVTFTQGFTSILGNQPISLNLTNTDCMQKQDFSGGGGAGINDDYLRIIETDTGPGLQPGLLAPSDANITTVDTLDVELATYPANAQVFTAEAVGTHWTGTPADMDNAANLESGNYGIAYYLEDPDTGRKTSLSKIAMVNGSDLVSKAEGTITVITTTIGDINTEWFTLNDGSTTITFTFDSALSDPSRVNGEAYNIGTDGSTTAAHIAANIKAAIDLAHTTNKDIKIGTQDSGSNTVVSVIHDLGDTDTNNTITYNVPAGDITFSGMSGAANFDPGYIGLEIVYDSGKFSKARIFRSVKLEEAGGTYAVSVVQLDKIITLQHYHSANQNDTSTGIPYEDTAGAFEDYRRAIYYFRLSDLALIYQDPFHDRSIFDENMPKASTGIEFDGILITSDTSGETGSSQSDGDSSEDRFRGLGEFRWSSMAEMSPELFPPENYFVPAKVSDTVIKFERTAGAILGFAENTIMHISREFAGFTSYMKILPVHEGYGLVDRKATQSVGPFVYYVNSKGLKSIDAQGRLDSLHALDQLIEEWGTEYSYISLGYDSEMSTLFILNSNQQKAAVMWFSTSMVSELHDLPFDLVKTGEWPSDLGDEDSDLTQRALFLQNAPDLTEVSAHWSPCVWVVDSKREDTITGSVNSAWNGTTRTTLLHHDKDTRFKISGIANGGLPLPNFTLDNVEAGEGGVPVWDSTDSLTWVGSYIYCISSTTESNIGKKCQIKQHSGSSRVVTYMNLQSGWVPAIGDRVAISPVYMKWSGSLLGYNDPMDPQNPTPSGMFITRNASALSCYFSSVGGAPTSDTVNAKDIFYRASLYEGDSTTEVSYGIPKSLSGNIVKSISDGESTNWAGFETHGVRGIALAPCVEIFCPDLDFRLLSCIIEGKILPTLRTERPT